MVKHNARMCRIRSRLHAMHGNKSKHVALECVDVGCDERLLHRSQNSMNSKNLHF